MQYYQVLISAEQTPQANRILDALMAKQLVMGGPIIGGPAKFLWNFAASAVPEELRESRLVTVEQDYRLIVGYTREDAREELVRVAEEASLEEVCMISFLLMEPNRRLAQLIDDCFAGRGESTPTPINATVASTFVREDRIVERTDTSARAIARNDLPQVVLDYIDESTGDGRPGTIRLFTDTARVTDEGKTHEGTRSIETWLQDTTGRFDYTLEFLEAHSMWDGRIVVSHRLVGDFPGSPVDLGFIFRLDADRISELVFA